MEIPVTKKKAKRRDQEELISLEELKEQLKSYFKEWMRNFKLS